MESVETLKGLIGESRRRIGELNAEIAAEKRALSHLYAELFYAENGMERGQHFMYNGKEYAKVFDGDNISIKAYPLTKKGEVSSVWNYIYRSDYGKIIPLPMGNDKKEK